LFSFLKVLKAYVSDNKSVFGHIYIHQHRSNQYDCHYNSRCQAIKLKSVIVCKYKNINLTIQWVLRHFNNGQPMGDNARNALLCDFS